MLRNGISLSRLMQESTDRIEIALHSENSTERLIATRVLENPSTWRQWEDEHSGLMRQVAVNGFWRMQAAILKKASLRLIQRKALFEYLRAREVRGTTRRRIFAYFHPTTGYTHAVVAEHALYLRKACSFLCTSHVGTEVVHDVGFLDPMHEYEALHTEYFQLFCDTYFGTNESESAPQTALLPLLKLELDECRKIIMNPGEHLERQLRDAEARRPAGDTMRLPALTLPAEERRVEEKSWTPPIQARHVEPTRAFSPA